MRKIKRPTYAQVNHALALDPVTGDLTHKVGKAMPNGGFRAFPGDSAGSGRAGSHGYRQITVCGYTCLAHQVFWLLAHRQWPTLQIDHINGVKTDNRLNNLREANSSQQQQNVCARSHNQSGLLGAHFHRAKGKFRSRITVDFKVHNLGTFDTAEEAHEAYQAAKAQLHTFQPTVRYH